MRKARIADLDVILAGGDDREGGGDGPLVVLLHGFGAPGDDLMPLWRQIAAPAGTRFAFPAAPLALDPQQFGPGRAWWMIDFAKLERAIASGEARDLTNEVPEALAESRERVNQLIDELAPKGPLVLGGFSQGAMLATDVALRTDRALAGLVLMSTTLIAESEWTPLFAKRAGLRVLMSHGRSDPLLPFAIAERLRDQLTEAGLSVEFVPFGGGHGLSDGIVDALAKFIREVAE